MKKLMTSNNNNLRFDQNRSLTRTLESDEEDTRNSAIANYQKKIFRNLLLNKSCLTLAKKMILKHTHCYFNLKTNIQISNSFLTNRCQITYTNNNYFLITKVFKALRSQQKIFLKSKYGNSSFNLRVCEDDDYNDYSSNKCNNVAVVDSCVENGENNSLLPSDSAAATDINNKNKTTQRKLKNALSSFWRRGNILRLLDFNFLVVI